MAERHCLCRHSIGLSESKNEKSRTLPDFFPLSQILGFGCRTMANHKWCIMIFWWFQFFFISQPLTGTEPWTSSTLSEFLTHWPSSHGEWWTICNNIFVLCCLQIFYLFNSMIPSRGIWSWSSHLWDGRLNHCAIGTGGWSNFVYIYFIFLINLV